MWFDPKQVRLKALDDKVFVLLLGGVMGALGWLQGILIMSFPMVQVCS